MAPKHPHLGSPGTPAFLARMMAIPALNDAFIFASHLYDNTKVGRRFCPRASRSFRWVFGSFFKATIIRLCSHSRQWARVNDPSRLRLLR